ncbi:MAG: hypothetical protein KTR31_34475 [Myxococcales bacterium]|nr:hypothetical protein [Myxococcales bacterium]
MTARFTAEDKRDTLWRKVIRCEYPKLPHQRGIEFVQALALAEDKNELLMRTFLREADELEPEHAGKIFHGCGTVAKVRWVPGANAQHHFTGFLRHGGVGLLRASLSNTDETFSPGIGLKLFADGEGVPTENLVASHTLEGLPMGSGFLDETLSTTIPHPMRPRDTRRLDTTFAFYGWRAITGVFEAAMAWTWTAEDPPSSVSLPLDALASRRPTGELEPEPRAPASLAFAPLPGMAAAFQDQSSADFRDVFRQHVLEGSELFEIRAVEGDDDETILGTLVVESRFVASLYGDQRLFFRHPLPRDVKATCPQQQLGGSYAPIREDAQ